MPPISSIWLAVMLVSKSLLGKNNLVCKLGTA